jgi:TrmH family RNA methyltransferase
MHIEELSSAHNPKIRELIKLSESSKERRTKELFTVEGKREIQAALGAGYIPVSLFLNREITSPEEFGKFNGVKTYNLTPQLYSAIAYRESTEGAVAVFETKAKSPDDIVLSRNPLVIVLESVEKPGNLGAILRTADATGADAVIICDPLTDLYNPNVIRSGIGTFFTVQSCTGTSRSVYEWLRSKELNIYSAELTASEWYHKINYSSPCAIVFGTESAGLSKFWIENCDRRIKIPMLGSADSLNVSVSVAVISYEAMRQRNFKI